MKDKEFWKWAVVGFLGGLVVLGLILGTIYLVFAHDEKNDNVKPSVEVITTKPKKVKSNKKHESNRKSDPVIKEDPQESQEREAVVARIQQFVKAGVENRPNFLSKSTGGMAARWWKNRYDAGYETTEQDMPMYYWFRSCQEVIVVNMVGDEAKAIATVVVNSPWKKGTESYTFDMVKENGRWQIHDIVGKGGSLRGKYSK